METTKQPTSAVQAFDASCFDGDYITGDIDAAYLAKLDAQRNDGAKNRSHLEDAVLELHNDEEL